MNLLFCYNFIVERSDIMKNKIILGLSILTLLLTGCSAEEKKGGIKNPLEKLFPKEEEKTLQIVDLESKSRPFAVMIDNHDNATPHTGLQDAYIVYEMVVEGGITRLMAIFKDQETATIGPVRSSRHYFLDYALENDAIYTHWGWSPQAQSDIPKLGVNNINALYDNSFWRDNSRNAPHNGMTSIEKLKTTANNKNYNRDTNKDLLLNYSVDSIELKEMEQSKIANNVSIRYSSYQTVTYEYDSTNKVYKRIRKGSPHVDKQTGKQYTAKNIIVYQIHNELMGSKGRQELSNIGTSNGYYITNGYAVPITVKKDSRSGQTVYKYLDGKEINVNDGNTFIQIQPKDQELKIIE
ncbi:MAG: DUF3048 domain-containing protein [Bacilli bacterium]